MAIWIAKAIIQKTISLLPWSHRLNFFFQKHVTKGLALTDDLFESKLLHVAQHIEVLHKHNKLKPGFSSLELGTGWYPVVPIGMYLHGAKNIYTADIKTLISDERVFMSCVKYIEYYDANKLMAILPLIDISKIERLRELINYKAKKEILELSNIKLLIGEIEKFDIPHEIDLIHSNNTFEHIYEKNIVQVLKGFKLYLKPGGLMSHFIDMSDHFSHIDKKISPYNFLKFSDFSWRFIDNTVQPQNRLRIVDYRRLFDSTGFEILEEFAEKKYPGGIDNVRINRKFRQLSKSDIEKTHVLFYLKLKE